MTLSELLGVLDDRGNADAASPDLIDAVRSVLALAAGQAPGSAAYLLHLQQAARLVEDSWPFASDLGALVLGFSRAATRDGMRS